MAKIALVLHVPDVTADQLKRIVHDVDVLDNSDPAYAIHVNKVGAEDILYLILSGQYNPHYDIFLDKVEDCLNGSCGDLK